VKQILPDDYSLDLNSEKKIVAYFNAARDDGPALGPAPDSNSGRGYRWWYSIPIRPSTSLIPTRF